MADENDVKEPDGMNVTLSESELKEYALSETPESIDQSKDDTKPDEAEAAAAEAQAKADEEVKAEADKKTAAEAEAKKKEDEKGGKDQDTEAKVEAEAKAKAEAEAEEDEEDSVLVKYAGKEYTQSDLDALIKGNMQAADYTQKTQELGGQRAAIEPLVKFIGQLKGDDSKEIVADIRAALVEDKGEDFGKLLDAALDFDSEKFIHPDTQKVKDLQDKVDKAEAIAAFSEAQKTFITDMKAKDIKISRKEAEEVGKFTLDYFTKNEAALSLEDAYKLMKADGWRTKATEIEAEAEKKAAEEKAKKGHDSIPQKDKGASDFSTEKKTPADMNVTMDDAKEAGVPTFFE